MHLGLKLTEGKVAMPIKVYERMAKNLFCSKEKEDVFFSFILCAGLVPDETSRELCNS